MNKQPFYHRADVLFTCTEPLSREEFIAALAKGLKRHGLVKGGIEVEEYDEPDPGDPADLMG